MKKLSLVGLLMSCVAFSACSTAKLNWERPIETEHTLFGTMYRQEGKNLDRDEMANQLKIHPASQETMKGWSTVNGFALVTSGVGGFLIGWPIGTSLGGGTPNW